MTVKLSFYGKDSVPFEREIELPSEVAAVFKELYNDDSSEAMFPDTSAAEVGTFLKNAVKSGDISPKVLRTAKCNTVLVKKLKELTTPKLKNASTTEKVKVMYEANLAIAKTLNHQKNVAKGQAAAETKKKEAKALAEQKLQELEARVSSMKEGPTKERLLAQLQKRKEKVEKAAFDLEKKKETANINLGTSLNAYADFRIVYSWCADVGLDPAQIYSKALLEKSAAFKDTDPSFWKSV